MIQYNVIQNLWYNVIKCRINYILIKNNVQVEERESTGIWKLVHWFESEPIDLTDDSPETNPVCQYQVFQWIEISYMKKKTAAESINIKHILVAAQQLDKLAQLL